MRKRKILTLVFMLIAALAFPVIYFCNKRIDDTARGKLYTNLEAIPYNKVGVLLGTAKFLEKGYINPYYKYRLDAAVQLLKSGKIKYVIVSGDNSRQNYNEPEQMRSDLIEAGIDSTVIYADYAGFRTFDSMIRVKEIFGQSSITVISQPFHNERAVYIALKEGLSVVGFNARDVNKSAGFRVQVREKLARVKVFIDYVFGIKPRFLGKQINIP